MKINPLKLTPNRSLVAMALAAIAGLPVLGQSEQLSDGPIGMDTDRLTSRTVKSTSTSSVNPRASLSPPDIGISSLPGPRRETNWFFSGVSTIILRSACGKLRSASSMQTARVFIRSQMPRKPTSTRLGPGTGRTLRFGTERTRRAGDTT